MSPLYFLPFDHRESFEHGLFGWSGQLSSEQEEQIRAAKQVIYEALLQAIAAGVDEAAAGVLVDEQFGSEILADANARGLVTACPAEQSGQQEFHFQYGDDFAYHIERVNPTFCKVLVRYNPEGDAALNRRQEERLQRLSAYLRSTHRRFLFELLVPPEQAHLEQVAHDMLAYDVQLRPSLVVNAIRELQDAGIEPDVWKVEGLDRREDCIAIAGMARRQGRDHVTCIVLGRHADDARVQHWLEVAASVPAFIGFAVGRTTFWDPLAAWIAKRTSRTEAIAMIANNYRRWVDIWKAARGEQAWQRTEAERHADRTPGR
jgi:5-dehydro-2-deoxygluconokinase